MFFEGDRIDAMREMILAETLEDAEGGAGQAAAVPARGLRRHLPRAEGLPGDDPLPRSAAARVPAAHARSSRQELAKKIGVPAATHPRSASQQLHEFNPMLGFRGCRLGIGYPEISAMQARAVFEAAAMVAEGRHQGPARDHDPAGRLQEGARPADRDRAPGGARGAGRAEGQAELPGRHDDRDPARRADGRRDRAVGRVLQLRHQRPDADRPRHVARRLGLVPAAVPGARDREEEPVRDDRRRPASASWWRSR